MYLISKYYNHGIKDHLRKNIALWVDGTLDIKFSKSLPSQTSSPGKITQIFLLFYFSSPLPC